MGTHRRKDMLAAIEKWTAIENGKLPLPDPFPELVCVDYPSDSTTYWSRLRYRRWPLLVLSSGEVSGSQFDTFGSTQVVDDTVTIPSEAIRGTKLERETRDDEPLTFEEGTFFVLRSQGDMRNGDLRSAYAMTFGQAGALREIFVFLPTPS